MKTPLPTPTDTQRLIKEKNALPTVKSLFNHGLLSHYITCIMTVKDIPVSRWTQFLLALTRAHYF